MPDTYRFVFCPYDGSRLEVRPHEEGAHHPTCPACEFTDYANPKPCVAVLVEEGDRLLLGRRAIEPARGRWDILGGFIKKGETAEEAVRREIREETGLDVVLTDYLGSFPDTYGLLGEPTLSLAFTARPAGGVLRPASDVAELRWFRAADVPGDLAFPHQPKLIEVWRQATRQ